jgi:hypothetical protein
VNEILIYLLGFLLVVASAVSFLKWSWKSLYAAAPMIALGVIVNGFFGDISVVILSSAMTGFITGYAFKNTKPLHFYILAVTLSLTALSTANYYYLKIGNNIDLLEHSRKGFIEYVNKSEVPEDKRKEIMTRLNATMDMVRDVVPFSYFLNFIVFSAFFFMMLKSLLRKMAPNIEDIGGLEHFKLNDYFIFTIIAGWMAVLLVDKTAYEFIYIAGLNIALIFSCLYFIQAIGIIKFFMIQKGFSPYIMLAAVPLMFLGAEYALFFSVMLASFGAIDFWADFRKMGTAGGRDPD